MKEYKVIFISISRSIAQEIGYFSNPFYTTLWKKDFRPSGKDLRDVVCVIFNDYA